jgi:TRAP-type C4-dicarboxylate transport system substrate-binding protein
MTKPIALSSGRYGRVSKGALRYAALCAALSATGVFSASAQEAAQLKFGFPAPPTSFVLTEATEPWTKDVEAATNGAVKFTIYPGGSVGNFTNILDRTLNAVVDIAFGIFGPYSDQFPRTQVTSLPFEANNTTETAVALWRLYDKGVIAPEFGQVKVVTLFNFPASALHSKKPIKTLDDVRGMKFSVTNRTAGQIAELLGMAPVSLTPADVYQSMQRGVIDGMFQAWTAVQTFKLYEVTNHHVNVPVGQQPAFIFMNKASFTKLPAASQQTIDRLGGEPFARRYGKAVDANDDSGQNAVKGMAGQNVSDLAAAESARWKERLKPVVDGWVKATPDGARVLAEFRREVTAVRQGK